MSRIYPFVFALAAASLFAGAPPPTTAPVEPQPTEPSVTFHSDVSMARVDAQVLDQENRPIQGLQMEDFILREGGKQQEIRHFVTEKLPVDVILLLDVSRSMEPHVQRIASAAHQALGVLGDQDRIAILVFDRATRVRMSFRNSRQDAERELEQVVEQEAFDGGTDITKGLLDAAAYMARNARHEARRAIVILTDDQTELDRDDAGVIRALKRADSVLSALIAPDALHTGSGGASQLPDDELFEELLARMNLPPGFSPFGPRTHSAGTSKIARQSGGDSMTVEDASAFQDTLARIRERYGLYFYLPEGAKPDDTSSIEVELTEAARQSHPGAEVRFRLSHLADSHDSENIV